MNLSQNIRIVLIETSHPGNIGAVARAMKNMCMSQLYLVNPRDFPSPVATARSTGAIDILQQAAVCQTLPEALADCQLVVGASARLRSIDMPQLTPREFAEQTTKSSSKQNIAILFGREDAGLTNEELDKCHNLLHIPTNPEFSSLNIAAAAQVICYELYQQSCLQELQTLPGDVGDAGDELADGRDLEGFYQHLETSLTAIGFLKPPSCNKLLRRLRRLFNRAQLDKTEVNILRGILSAAEGRKYKWLQRNSAESVEIDNNQP